MQAVQSMNNFWTQILAFRKDETILDTNPCLWKRRVILETNFAHKKFMIFCLATPIPVRFFVSHQRQCPRVDGNKISIMAKAWNKRNKEDINQWYKMLSPVTLTLHGTVYLGLVHTLRNGRWSGSLLMITIVYRGGRANDYSEPWIWESEQGISSPH